MVSLHGPYAAPGSGAAYALWSYMLSQPLGQVQGGRLPRRRGEPEAGRFLGLLDDAQAVPASGEHMADYQPVIAPAELGTEKTLQTCPASRVS